MDQGNTTSRAVGSQPHADGSACFELDAWLETHDEPVVLIDQNFRIVAANEAYCTTFHTATSQMAGRRCYATVHHHNVPCFEVGEDCPLQRSFEGERRPTCLHTHFDGAGVARWVQVTGHRLVAEDGTPYFAESLREIAPEDPAIPRAQAGREMVGNSPVFLQMVEKLDRAARTLAPILLLGETGTGKELAAHFIHRYSPRREGPYLCLDCAAVPESLFESEVFGHERGSFTGSAGRRKGVFELAHGGTLFLDEIGEIPLSMQPKLLRVLETHQFRRVGGEDQVHVDVRVVCATNRHLWEGVQEGSFREDLYHRIACFCVRVPPLRERLADLPVLVEKLIGDLQPPPPERRLRFSPDALEILAHYHYPGNVRELRNILQVAVASCPNGLIHTDTLAPIMEARIQAALSTATPGANQVPAGAPAARRRVALGYPDAAGVHRLGDLEKLYISELLEQHRGVRKDTAATMGISVRTLYRKMRRHGIP